MTPQDHLRVWLDEHLLSQQRDRDKDERGGANECRLRAEAHGWAAYGLQQAVERLDVDGRKA